MFLTITNTICVYFVFYFTTFSTICALMSHLGKPIHTVGALLGQAGGCPCTWKRAHRAPPTTVVTAADQQTRKRHLLNKVGLDK